MSLNLEMIPSILGAFLLMIAAEMMRMMMLATEVKRSVFLFFSVKYYYSSAIVSYHPKAIPKMMIMITNIFLSSGYLPYTEYAKQIKR